MQWIPGWNPFIMVFSADTVESFHIWHHRYEASFVSFNVVTGNDNIKTDSDIKIYPNPAQESITIEITAPVKNAAVSIYNMQGQLVMQQL